MKILFFCGHYVHGHDYFNIKTIENLRKCGELIVIEPPQYLPSHTEGVKYVESGIVTPKSRFPHLVLFISTLRNYSKAVKVANANSVDVIIVGEYEFISIWLFRFLTRKKSYLIHHYNIDQLERKRVFKGIFDLIKNSFYHITLEDFIKNHLIDDLDVEENKVFCWNHPAEPTHDQIVRTKTDEYKYDCVGLSSSNDEDFIHAVIEFEKRTHSLSSNNLKVILKSNLYSFESEGLRVIKGYIPQEDYDSYADNAFCSLSCYPETYEYRASAVISESIWKRQVVVGTDIKLVRNYKSQYPNIFHICKPENLTSILLQLKNIPCAYIQEEIDSFLDKHSDKYIQSQMDQTFRNTMNE